MDSEDDTRDGLDQLSSLFEPRTAPLPAQPAAPVDAVPPTGAEPSVPPTSPAAAFVSDPPARPPFSPPPLVPVGASRTREATPPDPAGPAAGMSAAGTAFAASAASAEPRPAPAFGGAVIAPARGRRAAIPSSALQPPTIEPPTSAAPTLEPPIAGPAPSDPTPLDPTPSDRTPPDARSAPPAPAPIAPAPVPSAMPSPPLDPSGPLLPGEYEEVDEERLARSTPLERVIFALAFLVPPVGLIGSIVAAARSSSRRGWVIGLLRAGMAVGVVFSLVAAGFAYVGYNALQQQQAHDRIAAASAGFCAAMTKDPTLARGDGGWPQPAGSVPQSLTAMQAFVDRWNALAKVSPSGIRSKVATVAAAGSEVIKTVTAQRTIDDADNRSLVESAVSSSGVQNWRAEYCG